MMELIFSLLNPEDFDQLNATSKWYRQLFSKNSYRICAPTYDELDRVIDYLVTKVSAEVTSRPLSFSIKKPPKKVCENITKFIIGISKIKNIVTLDISELTLPDSSLNHLADLENLRELSVAARNYEGLSRLGNLSKLTLHGGDILPRSLDSMTNLCELNLLSSYCCNINRTLQGLINPTLLTRLHIVSTSSPENLDEISHMSNLMDLQLDYKHTYRHIEYYLPLKTTSLFNLSSSFFIKPKLVVANVHLTRLVLRSRVCTDSELSILTRLKELSILTPTYATLTSSELRFMEHLAIRSLTVMSATTNFTFLYYIRQDSLKELKIDLLTDQTSLEGLSRLTGLESLEIVNKPGTRNTATKFNVSNLTLLTRLVTPQNFCVLMRGLPSLLELTRSTEIDSQMLQMMQKLTKLEVYSKVELPDNLPTSLQELVMYTDTATLSTLTNLTRLELYYANTCSWALTLTKLKKLEIMNFVTRSKLDSFSALKNLTCLSVGCSEALPSDGYPFVLLTNLQLLQLTAVSDATSLSVIEAKLPRLLTSLDTDF